MRNWYIGLGNEIVRLLFGTNYRSQIVSNCTRWFCLSVFDSITHVNVISLHLCFHRLTNRLLSVAMSPKAAPYGTWSSPITADVITQGVSIPKSCLISNLFLTFLQSIDLPDVLVDHITSTVYHIESRPSEEGRSVLVHT